MPPRPDERNSLILLRSLFFFDQSGCIENCNCSPMNNALGSDIHIRTGSHLSILRNTKRIKLFPVILRRIIWNHHSVSNNKSGARLQMRGTDQADGQSRLQVSVLRSSPRDISSSVCTGPSFERLNHCPP